MLCSKCKLREATSHIHSVVNGVVSDTYLCSECAAKVKTPSFTDDNIFKMLSSMLYNDTASSVKKVSCDGCGVTLDEISRTGRVGCGKCYETFKKEIEPALIKIHGRTAHIGKRPYEEVTAETKPQGEISVKEQLKIKLAEAVKNEEYEKAAVLRDELKRLSEE